MKLLIVLQHRFELWNAPDWFVQRLRQEFPNLEITHLRNYDGIDQEIPEAEIAVTWSLRPEQFALAKKLRWIHSPAAAVHQLMFPELIASDVILTNAREVHGPVVAEHVMALIFALAKNIPESVRMQSKHVWGQEILWNQSPRPREVSGATLGLIGIGSIGRHVAQNASAIGMRVIAAREHTQKEKPLGVDEIYPSSEIDKLIAQSDYVVLAAPLTPATRGIMDVARFARMKPGAALINVGRAPLIQEPALIDALRSRKIVAALDVFEQEPLPANSPLWDSENLLITPHTAGLTDKLWERHYALFSENLRRYLSHQPLLSEVDKSRGY